MHDLSDTILMQKIRNGSEKAFREVYDRYLVQMIFIAKKYLKDTNLAEDAVQDIHVKVWEKRHALDHVNSIKSYLFTMVRNHVKNMLRNRKSESLSLSGVKEKKLPFKNPSEEKLQYREYETILKKGMRELSGRMREVFDLRTIKSLTNSEVTKLLRIQVHTIKTQYNISSKFIDHHNFFKNLVIKICRTCNPVQREIVSS